MMEEEEEEGKGRRICREIEGYKDIKGKGIIFPKLGKLIK